jgi:hypothetical protein
LPRLVESWQIQKKTNAQGAKIASPEIGEGENESTEAKLSGKKVDKTSSKRWMDGWMDGKELTQVLGFSSILVARRKEVPRRRNTTKSVVN